ncbi:hypothetical protein MS3_00003345 [Schistosoma haematobium]|uniref:Uncharacterized protein n=1 Tax=Schistosoma haematobium TaxID=6185 RepID=A0A922LP70_SCHHA|nr:hypothetical protein MS3_00003345 [Schistosoma haematobium]KAH9590814.1 hypothetical protein MS3_00003345 [Schistosoma haematobium]
MLLTHSSLIPRPLLYFRFRTTVSSISTMHPTPPNDRRRRVILLAQMSRQYSYHWTAEVSVTSANAAASVTGVFINQFATIIMICLSDRRDRAKKVPVRADVFFQHEGQRNTISPRCSGHLAPVI